MTTNTRIIEIVEHSLIFGVEETCKHFGLKPESINRYIRFYKEHNLGMDIEKNKTLLDLSKKFSTP